MNDWQEKMQDDGAGKNSSGDFGEMKPGLAQISELSGSNKLVSYSSASSEHLPEEAKNTFPGNLPAYGNFYHTPGGSSPDGVVLPVHPPAPVPQTNLYYHRLSYADPKSCWWKPLLEGLLGGTIFLLLNIMVTVLFVLTYLAARPGLGFQEFAFEFTLANLQTKSLTDPSIFMLMFMSVAVMWPSLYLARLVLGPKPWGLVHSVAGKIRWSWLLLCTAIALIVYVILPVAYSALVGELTFNVQGLDLASSLVMILLVLLVVPLQCYAEELVFRGYLMQTIGRWLKHPAFAITLSALLFMLGHKYDAWGQASVLFMGLAAGFMVWYTGGLEAGIAMHVVNNVYLMLLGVLGITDPFAQGGSGWSDFLFAAGIETLLVVLVMYAAKRTGLKSQN